VLAELAQGMGRYRSSEWDFFRKGKNVCTGSGDGILKCTLKE